MTSLMKKDLYFLKESKRTLLIILIFLAAIVAFNYKGTNKLTIEIIFFSLTYIVFSLSYVSLYYDTNADFNKYIKFLPITKEDYVKSKFYFALTFYIIETLIIVLLTKILFLNLNTQGIIKIISLQIITGGIIIHEYFKKGGMENVTRFMQIIFLITFIILIIFGMLKEKFNINVNLYLNESKSSFIMILISLALYFIILKLTLKMEGKR